MTKETAIKLFNDRKIRTQWDEEEEKWYFSIVDVLSVLTESVSPSAYWRKLKQRLKEEGNETVTNCHGLKMRAEATTTEISKDKKPETFEQSRQIARKGGSVAGNTRKEIEQNIGKKVVTRLNAKSLDKDKPKEIE